MEIKIDRRDDNSALLTVSVKAADYQGELDKALNQYQKKANIKGFRPGKAPIHLLKKMFGTDLKADAIINAINKELAGFMEAEQLNPMFMPMQKNNPLTADSIAHEEDYTFEFEVMPEPAFELGLESMTFEKYKLVASEADIDEAVERAKDSVKNVQPVDQIAKGDFVRGMFRNADGSFESESVLPTNQVADAAWSAFEGKAVGDSIAFDIREALPEDKQIENLFFPAPEEMGKFQGSFTLEVTEITRNVAHELNQDFFDKVIGPERATTEEEFRKAVKEDMEEYNQGYATSVFTNDIRKHLMDAIDFAMPAELLAKVYKFNREKPKTDEEVEREMPSFMKAVKWQAISNRIAREAGIKISQEEIKAAAGMVVRAELSRMGLNLPNEHVGGIIDYMLKGKEKDRYMDTAYDMIFSERLNDYVASKATVKDREVSFKEFDAEMATRNKQEEAVEAE